MPSRLTSPGPNLLPVILGISGLYCFIAWHIFGGPAVMASYVCMVLYSLRSNRSWHTYFTASVGSLILLLQGLFISFKDLSVSERLMLDSLILISLWGAAILGVSTVRRTRLDMQQLAEQLAQLEQAERLATAIASADIWLWEFNSKLEPVWDENPLRALNLHKVTGSAANRFRIFKERTSPELACQFDAEVRAAIRAHQTHFEYHFSLSPCEGQLLHFKTSARILYDVDGNLQRIIGATTNITSEVQRNQLLQEQIALQQTQHERMKIAARTAGLWIWERDTQNNQFIWDENRPVEFGLDDVSYADFIPRFGALVVDDDLPQLVNTVKAAMNSGASSYSVQYRTRSADSNEIRYRHSIGNIQYDANGAPIKLIGVTRDVTEQVQLQAMIEREAQFKHELSTRLNMAIETAGLHCWQMEHPSARFIWSQNAAAELGAHAHDGTHALLLPELLRDIHPDDVAQLTINSQAAQNAGRRERSFTYRRFMPDGTLHHFRTFHRYFYHPDGSPSYTIGATADITREVLANNALAERAAEEHLALARLNIATRISGIHSWQCSYPEFDFTWSENAQADIGEQAIGQPLSALRHLLFKDFAADGQDCMRQVMQRACADGSTTVTHEFTRSYPDGSTTHHRLMCKLVRNEQGEVYSLIGAAINITEEVERTRQLQQQAEQIKLMHERTERAARSSQEGHWEVNLQTGEHWVSDSYRTILGYPSDYDLSTVAQLHALVHPDDDLSRMDRVLAQLADGEMFVHNYRMRHATGEWRWMQARGAVECDADGKPLRITGSLRDIHEQKITEEQLQTAQQRLARAINGTEDGLWEVELLTGRMWLSPRYMAILGHEAIETTSLTGLDIDHITHPDDLPQIMEQRQRCDELNIPLNFEHRMLNKQQQWIWVRVRGTIEKDASGNSIRAAGSMIDVTEAHEAHEQLLAAIEDARQANQAKSAFLANMSHEIRTPMNGIIGMSGLLLDTELDRAQHDFAETIRNSADSLLSIINDILDFSKIEAGKLDIDMLEMDLRSNVEDVGTMLGFQAASKNLELIVNVRPDVPERVIGDPQRVRQCLINLVGNAIKFTRQGEVVIEVARAGERDGKLQLRFSVKDTGIGLSTDAAAKLFQPFVQADSSTTRKYGGTGLGLSIVKRLIEMMHGEVGVISSVGNGSTFWFTLPMEMVAGESQWPALPVTAQQHKRLLIVDDNETNRRVLALQLQHLGYHTTLTSSGADALHELHQQQAIGRLYDAVLADFQMPDMDGAMLGEHINADPSLARMRLVLLTSMDRHGDARRFAAMGFAAYLTKPVRPRELRDCLQRVLSKEGHFGRDAQTLVTRNALAEQQAATRYRGQVLLVDDNLVNQKVGSRFLERMGLTVIMANDGAEAVKSCESRSFDMILMDLQMPVMDGFEATRRIRDHEGWRPHQPIIALTANAMHGQMERCLAAGMDGFLSKPIQIERLRETVAKYCVPVLAASAVTAPDEPDEFIPMAVGAAEHPEATEHHIEQLLHTSQLVRPIALNTEQFKLVTDGDNEFMRELAAVYIDSSISTLHSMQRALAAGDIKALHKEAHKLKGASANVHAEWAASLCEQLEKPGNPDGTPANHAALTERMTELDNAIHAAIEILNTQLADQQATG